ncbi:hypothetical protein [Clostridium pasteurianum]|nr:hypothetical protein [Clostridium pasteurianum]
MAQNNIENIITDIKKIVSTARKNVAKEASTKKKVLILIGQ